MPDPYPVPRDLNELDHRIGWRCVIALAGYSRATLNARIKAGRMPAPVDRGGEGAIFVRDDVLRALGLAVPAQAGQPLAINDAADPWDFEPGAINDHLARTQRENALLGRGVKRGSREWHAQLGDGRRGASGRRR